MDQLYLDRTEIPGNTVLIVSNAEVINTGTTLYSMPASCKDAEYERYAKEYDIHAITFNYGQKAFKQELLASKAICERMGFKHSVIDLPWLAEISNSSLNTDDDIPEVSEDDLDDVKK